MKKIQVIGIFLILLFFSSIAEAKKIKFSFNGKELLKQEESHGKIEISAYCKNKIDLKKYNIWANGLSRGIIPDEIYVSPDEKYFLFQGPEGSPRGRLRFLLVNINQCRIVKEFKPGNPRNAIGTAAFSPDSKELYITWLIGSPFYLTKEYSGKNFETEKILKNMPFLGRTHDRKLVWWFYSYKFSKKGDTLVHLEAPKRTWTTYIYDVTHDKVISSFKSKTYFGNKKYFSKKDYFNKPDITKDFLLYNFDTPTGTEMDIFNYNTKKVVSKIINAQKGLGSFSGDGKKIIFAEFPNTTTWKRNVIVYDKATGSVLGQAVLDEQDDIVDVSSDNTKLIYKRNGVQKTVNIR